jgi:hypothetical protein
MENISLHDIFEQIDLNVDINIIFKHFDNLFKKSIEYDIFFNLIYNRLNKSYFVLDFLNKFISKYYFIKKLLIVELINKFKYSDIDKIKNFLLIEDIPIEFIFLLLKCFNFELYMTNEIIKWLIYIGNTQQFYDLFDYINEKNSTIPYIIKFITSAINTFFNLDEICTQDIIQNIFNKITIFLNKKIILLYDKKTIFESLTNSNDILYKLDPMYNNYNQLVLDKLFIDSLIRFYSHIIKNLKLISSYYTLDSNDEFNILNIIYDILYFYNIIVSDIDNEYINKNDFLELLPELLSNNNDIINVHTRVIILIKIKNILISEYDINYNDIYIPNNLGIAIINFLSTVKFLDWSFEHEIYTIYNSIFKLLYVCKQKNKLVNYYQNYGQSQYDILFYILLYQKEIFTLIKTELDKETTFINYTAKKEKIYGLYNLFNLSLEIEFNLYDTIYNIIPLDLSYKFNLTLDEYITHRLNSSLNKFNSNDYLDSIIYTKIFYINKYFEKKSYYYYGISYDNLLEYIKIRNIKITQFMSDEIEKYKILFNELNESINTTDDIERLDPIFSIQIINPYMIPNSNDIYEEVTMKLLCRETQKNPFTRDKFTLDDLINYNNLDEIKLKCNNFKERKNII